MTFSQSIFIWKTTRTGGGRGRELMCIPTAAYQCAILCTSWMLWQWPGPLKQNQNYIFAGALFLQPMIHCGRMHQCSPFNGQPTSGLLFLIRDHIRG